MKGDNDMSEIMRVGAKGTDNLAHAFRSDAEGNLLVDSMGCSSLFPITKMEKLLLPTPDGTNNEAVHFTTANAYIPNGLNGYKYWGAFTPFYKIEGHTNDYTENPCIVASNDGINWVVPSGVTNPLFGPPETGYYADTSLVWDGQYLYLYWQHYGTGISETYRSKSSNGVDWSEPERVYASNGLSVGEVFFRIGQNCWVAYDRHFGRAYSTDGIHFGSVHYTPCNLDNQIGMTYHVGIFNDGMRYHFLTSKSPYRASADLARQTYCAIYHGVSEDGTYIEYDPSPIWTLDTNSFLTNEIRRAEIAYGDGQDYFLYVFGADENKKFYSGVSKVRFGNLSALRQSQSSLVVFDDYEVRDTSLHWGQFADTSDPERLNGALPQISKYKNKSIKVFNTHDKAITLGFADQSIGQTIKIGDVNQEIQCPIYNYKSIVIQPSEYAILNTKLPCLVKPYLKAAEAPASGKITIEIYCWD